MTRAFSSSCLLLLACAASPLARALDTPKVESIPAEVKPFILPGTQPIALEAGDLNGDGRSDYVLVVERPTSKDKDPSEVKGERPLFVLVRQPDGTLKLAARNDSVVYCSTCGGMMGDPFQGIEIGPKSFTVGHYGGSGWRWSINFTFGYSRRDDTWQLVKVEQSSFHASDPEKMEQTISKPPRSFGKIDLADFDADTWDARSHKKR